MSAAAVPLRSLRNPHLVSGMPSCPGRPARGEGAVPGGSR